MAGDAQPFSHQIESDQAGRTVLRLSGELDMAAAPAFPDALHELQQRSAEEIVVDLRGLTFLDSSGLGSLIKAYVARRDGHQRVFFVAGGRSVHRVFQITRMDEQVTWVEPPV